MTKTELIEEIIKTYNSEMASKYTAYLKRQNKVTLEQILAARKEVTR